VRVTRTIATSLFLGWLCQRSLASPPCIERPTPPPCCADGQCFASPLTYGYYNTRWRRWPLESVAQASTTNPAELPAQLRTEVAPFVTPPAEQEDRKAPPPSVPGGEQTTPATGAPPRAPGAPGGANPPQGAQPPGGLGAPGTQPRSGSGYSTPGLPTPPQSVPLAPPAGLGTPPAGQGTPPTGQPMFKNVSPESPLNRSGPMGEADPPPSLPFGPALVAPEQPTRDVTQRPASTPRMSPIVKPANAPSSDPPPAPPIALASYEE
jgi:hypothetical protein